MSGMAESRKKKHVSIQCFNAILQTFLCAMPSHKLNQERVVHMQSAMIAQQFDVDGRVFSVEPLGSGNVNDTYLAIFRTVFSEQKVVIQKINKHVFKDPCKVMQNMHLVTEHVHDVFLREQNEADRIWQLPKVIPTKDGKDYFVDKNGNFWRCITRIASAHSYEKIKNADHAHEIGAVLGQFHHAVADLNCELLHDTLPGFHITPSYFQTFDEALKTEEGRSRLASSKVADNVYKFLLDRRQWSNVLEDAKARGELQLRVVHGDPKTANVMIDDVTGKGTAIIDLDTVKPGLIHYDLGDCLRSCCNPAGEETHNISEVVFDLDLCHALLKGYREQAHGFLTDAEKVYLYDSVRLITYELALRFFADYLAGDVYFKVREDGQNLLRARIQAQLCRSIEARESQIRSMLDKL